MGKEGRGQRYLSRCSCESWLTRDSDQFGTDVGEKSVRDCIPNTEEDSDVVLIDVMSERTRI